MKPSEIQVGMYFADRSRRRSGNVYPKTAIAPSPE